MPPEVLLNGSPADQGDLKPWVQALGSRETLTQWGGGLWKFFLKEGTQPAWDWAVSPALWGGERLNHFELKLRSLDPRCLIGSVSARGDWLVLVKLPRQAWDQSAREFVRREWRAFQELLAAGRFSTPAPLDLPTRIFLEEAGIFTPPPEDLMESV